MVEPNGNSVLRHRNFALYWVGQTVSYAGNGVYAVALPLEVLKLTNSSVSLAAVIGADALMSVIFLLIGGALVDRLSRRRVMLTANLASAAAIGLVALLIASGRVRLWELLVLSLCFGLANSFFMPASTAIVADILPPDLLVAGNALSTLSYSMGQALAGPLLGGLIVVTVGTGWAFGLDAISFLIGAASLIAMKAVARPRRAAAAEAEAATQEASSEETEPAASPSSMLGEIRAGLTYSRSTTWLWWNMLAMGAANFVAFVPLVVLEPLLVKHVFHAGAVALGSVFAASGAGGVAASLYIKLRGAPRSRVPAMWAAFAGSGVAVILLGSAPYAWLAAVAAGLVWFGLSYGNVIWFALMQEKVPSDLLGRVSSLDWMISLMLGPFGILVGASLAGAIGPRTTLILGGAVSVALAAIVFLPKVRDLGPNPARTENPSPTEAETSPATSS